MTSKKEITRLIKCKTIYRFLWSNWYTTRKDRRNKKFSWLEMRSSKGRTKIRRLENVKYRRNKFEVSPHKKFGINYKRSIW
jgi:hypothetical protein